jgi:polyribonucleotide nucleotidyltransferase
MGKQIPISKTFELAGKTYTVETGKLAALADGAVMFRQGNTMILATVVSSKEAKPDAGFFPLTVEYREKFAAAGRIPGNFFRRETRPSDYEVLISRLIDRAVRPLFPDNYMFETQIIVTLLSADKETQPDALAAFAASAAFAVSDIPFEGPISEVRVAKINGEYMINPSTSQIKEASLNLIVAGTERDILMVEGEAKECQEVEMVEAIKIGHDAIKMMCQVQHELRELCGNPAKRAVEPAPSNDEIKAAIWSAAQNRVLEVSRAGLSKAERKAGFKTIKEEVLAAMLEQNGEEFMAENKGLIEKYYSKMEKETIREMIISEKRRLDGRELEQVRPIWSEVDYLPSAHGSALFTRGETQSLTTVTLGSKLDEAMVDNALEMTFDKFMLHYNFPPFCTGEAKMLRGTSRREVGHGNLARRSLEQVLPEGLAYTVRVVSDILESNGSSSMATVCAGSLALMDAGVKITSAVSGIAMGMISDENGRYAILSDILGDEDHLGDMDFKVTGTEKGICGCQMDIKIDGMPYELLEQALDQARRGRLHILGEMNKTISKANDDFKPHAPRIVSLEVDTDYIGMIIGPGGKHIQGLQRETETAISIEEVGKKGIVTIAGTNAAGVKKAYDVIRGMTSEPEEGADYDAVVVKLMPFGAFVEFMPSRQGLVHISELSWTRIENIEDALSEGDEIRVRYMGIDPKTNKARLSRKVLMEKPEGYVERVREERPREDRPRDDRRDDRRRDDRPRR